MRFKLVGIAALAALSWLAACAINPATGKRQLVLVSEAQELSLGKESDRAITAQMGLYDDPGLQDYIQQLGSRMAALSERPGLDWTFRVVDDPVVNAFALPGGYIYITRGILAHINNEAELAGVVGHEIGHVTARHGVSQMSKAQLAQLGLGLGTILAPEAAQSIGELAQTGLSLLFLKYGRDDERQADSLGLRYMLKAGYAPGPMVDVFDMLGRVGDAAGDGQRLPGWLSTHPASENRSELVDQQIGELGLGGTGGRVGRDDYLDRIDRITFGEDPRSGYFEGNLFLHPEMAFRIEFPAGWQSQNQRQAVLAVNPEKNAIVQLTLASQATPEAALEEFLRLEGMTRTGPAMGSIGGFPTAGDGFRITQQQGTLEGRVGFVAYGGRVFQLLGYTQQDNWPAVERAIRGSLASFGRLTDSAALAVQAPRLQIVGLTRPMSLDEFARRYNASVTSQTLALINRLDDGATLAPGKYKVVTGGPPER